MLWSDAVRKAGAFVMAIFMSCAAFGANQSREPKRLEACGQVCNEIMNIRDAIPKGLPNNAECVIVIPLVLKFAIGIGGEFGRGGITCRTGQHFTGHWSAPAPFALEGADFGLQLGGPFRHTAVPYPLVRLPNTHRQGYRAHQQSPESEEVELEDLDRCLRLPRAQ